MRESSSHTTGEISLSARTCPARSAVPRLEHAPRQGSTEARAFVLDPSNPPRRCPQRHALGMDRIFEGSAGGEQAAQEASTLERKASVEASADGRGRDQAEVAVDREQAVFERSDRIGAGEIGEGVDAVGDRLRRQGRAVLAGMTVADGGDTMRQCVVCVKQGGNKPCLKFAA